MRRHILSATAALLAALVGYAATAQAGVGGASAKHPKKYVHTTKIAYTGACSVDNWNLALHGPEAADCALTSTRVTVGPRDRFLSVKAADMTGRPVAIAVVTSGVNATGGVNQVFCGSVKNFTISAGTYDVMPAIAVADIECPVPPTQGTISVSLSNRK